jgi:hypothetical protein
MEDLKYCKLRRVIFYSQSENWEWPVSGNVLPIQNLRQPSDQNPSQIQAKSNIANTKQTRMM